MKILAIEKETEGVNWEREEQTLYDEARAAYNLLLKGVLREIYFTEEKNAVLILECDSKNTALKLLNELPLVKKQLITFSLMELNPYTGFSRLMEI